VVSTRPIPEELKNFAKNDVLFFLEKIPNCLKPKIERKDFFGVFFLYVDGVLSQ
jgi:hypothetical protein